MSILFFVNTLFLLRYTFYMDIILAFIITIAIEVNIFILLDRKNIFLWLVATLMNLVLNISMNVLLYYITIEFWYWFTLWAYEIVTFIVEGFIIFGFFKYKLIKCLLVSFTANAASLIIGLFINQFVTNLHIEIILIILFSLLYFVGLGLTSYRFAKSKSID